MEEEEEGAAPMSQVDDSAATSGQVLAVDSQQVRASQAMVRAWPFKGLLKLEYAYFESSPGPHALLMDSTLLP